MIIRNFGAWLNLMIVPIIAVTGCDAVFSYKDSAFLPSLVKRVHLTDAEILTLRDVLLDGVGLINSDVQVVGSVEKSDSLGTYVVLADGDVRLLVDMTRIRDIWVAQEKLKGRVIKVLGTVQSGENGRLYLNAKIIRAG